MSAKRLRVALIGIGAWGERAHLPALEQCDGVDIVALVDSDIARTRTVASAHGIPRVYGDPHTLFQDLPALDAVTIATPTDTHYAIVLAALQADVNILCEKPLAFTVTQAREMVAEAKARGRVTKMGFLFRFSPVVELMKQLVDDGLIGKVVLVENLTLNAQFIDPTRPRHWKMQRSRANGGVFVEYGAHSIDLALWFGGPVTSVVAHGVTVIPERPLAEGGRGITDVDDASSWIATYQSGGEAIFRTSWASLPVGGGGLRVYGTRGSLAWQLDATTRRRERLLAATLDDPTPRSLYDFEPPFDTYADDGLFPLGLLSRYNARLVQSFVDDIRSGSATGPTFDDGLATQRVLDAIRISLDERCWVDVVD